jgi:hypothetical protein
VINRVLLLAPWITDHDWTGKLVDTITSLLPCPVEVVVGGCSSASDHSFAYDFLRPKIHVMNVFLDAVERLGSVDHVIVLDANYVNLRAVRAVLGHTGLLTVLIHGGSFQPFDLETQFASYDFKKLLRWDEANLALADHILIPTIHALKLFTAAYPTLAPHTTQVYWPLPSGLKRRAPSVGNGKIVAPSRNSWEKGNDIINALVLRGVNVDQTCNLTGEAYYDHLHDATACLVPARAEIFGYCAIEALWSGTIPLVPNGLSYKEMFELPPWLQMRHPVGETTTEELVNIIDRVFNLAPLQYHEIVSAAQYALEERLRDAGSALARAIMGGMHDSVQSSHDAQSSSKWK